MKIVEWTLDGMAISFEKRRRNTGKPSLRYEAWVKKCVELIGKKTVALGRVEVVEMEFSYIDKAPKSNSDRASSINDVLMRANVVENAGYICLPDTRQKGRYWQGFPMVKIKLRIDEAHPLNKGVNWKEWNVKKEW